MKKQILLAEDERDAARAIKAVDPFAPWLVIPMRSFARVRGHSAVAIWSTKAAREHARYNDAVDEALPSLIGRGAEPEIDADFAQAAQTAGLERVA